MSTHKPGLPGLYAACALLGLSKNILAEPWIAPIDDDLASIETILRQHQLYSPWSAAERGLPMAARR